MNVTGGAYSEAMTDTEMASEIERSDMMEDQWLDGYMEERISGPDPYDIDDCWDYEDEGWDTGPEYEGEW